MNAITALQRVWDGSQWVKAVGDSNGYIIVKPRRWVWIPRFTYFDTTNLTAGTKLTVINQPDIGSGRIYGMRMYVDGQDWGSAQGVKIILTVDGQVRIERVWCDLFNVSSNLSTHSGPYTAVYLADTTNYVFDGEILLLAEFAQGVKLEVQNQSTTHDTARCIMNILWGTYQEV